MLGLAVIVLQFVKVNIMLFNAVHTNKDWLLFCVII